MTNNKLPTACIYIDQNNIFFRYKKLDFVKLLKYIGLEYKIIKAVSFMAVDGQSDSQKKFVTYLSNNGFKCEPIDLIEDTNIDHILIPNMVNDFHNLRPSTVICISGDKHFAYSLDLLSKHGVRNVVIGAKDHVAFELLKVCDEIKYLENFDGVIL